MTGISLRRAKSSDMRGLAASREGGALFAKHRRHEITHQLPNTNLD